MAAILGIMRDVSGVAPPVEVEVVTFGEAGLPIDLRLLPLLVIMAVAIAGGMVPAASLVEEKEHRTLQALLISPASTGEVLLAKGLLGWILAMAAGVVTLAMNSAFGAQPAATLLGIAIGAVMMAQVGLLLGCWAPDTNTLFAAWKGGALFLLYPVITWLWPELPGWISRLGPTYYFLQPTFAVSVEGAALRDVAGSLAIAVLICAALVPAVAAMGRRLERRLAEGRIHSSKSAPAAPAAV
jgi:ABC-2 type transport system permease protein